MKGYTRLSYDSLGVYYYNENRQFHRTDGPAIEWSDGDKDWYIEGKRLTEEEFKRKTTRLGKALYL